ncbi:glutathione-dependent formaldehyde-activating GFA [Mycena albidolilacea]|uniref:Glutathione-dependent formaldehyde-activating GFA n=1 Tax=Mycena albidolilacea TaxID=1033008 RepID=A0AAD6ZG98_9AGAR|nr:glutathione-dependent formaldehyde-activating GFA [Mycena albidolilacea]
MTQPAEAKPLTLPIPWPENAEIKVHMGGCHCKKVRHEFEHPDIYAMPVMNCNCSICEDRGYLCVYTPKTKFRFTSGEDGLTQYQFGHHDVSHRFCSTCGTSLGPVGAPGRPFDRVVVVNTRTIDGVDLDRLEFKKHDGRSGG